MPFLALCTLLATLPSTEASAFTTPVALKAPQTFQRQRDPGRSELTLSAWLAGVDGDLDLRRTPFEADFDASDARDRLEDGDPSLMLRYEAGGPEGALLLEAVQLDLEEDAVGRAFELQHTMIEAALTYRLGEPPRRNATSDLSFEVLFGARWNEVDAEVAGRGQTRDWIDPFIGLRLLVDLSSSLRIWGRADIGGFDLLNGAERSDNLEAGLQLRLGSDLSIHGGYRLYRTEYDRGSFSVDLEYAGPFLGLGWRF